MVIAVDFDGTCVTHEYPNVGEDIGAVPVLKSIITNGHKIILWTMRSGKELQDAIEWFRKNEIPLYGVNTNPTQKEWTDSPKALADLYIDDATLGMRARIGKNGRNHVDWEWVLHQLGGLVDIYSLHVEVPFWYKEIYVDNATNTLIFENSNLKPPRIEKSLRQPKKQWHIYSKEHHSILGCATHNIFLLDY